MQQAFQPLPITTQINLPFRSWSFKTTNKIHLETTILLHSTTSNHFSLLHTSYYLEDPTLQHVLLQPSYYKLSCICSSVLYGSTPGFKNTFSHNLLTKLQHHKLNPLPEANIVMWWSKQEVVSLVFEWDTVGWFSIEMYLVLRRLTRKITDAFHDVYFKYMICVYAWCVCLYVYVYVFVQIIVLQAKFCLVSLCGDMCVVSLLCVCY